MGRFAVVFRLCCWLVSGRVAVKNQAMFVMGVMGVVCVGLSCLVTWARLFLLVSFLAPHCSGVGQKGWVESDGTHVCY